MANNNNKSGGGSGVAIVLIVLVVLGLLGSCGSSSDNEYRDTLNSGLEKYNNGEKMNKDEYNAVKSFNEWKDNQGEKKYDDWD